MDVKADDREKFCKTIVNNINQLKDERNRQEHSLTTLHRELKQLEAELKRAESELRALERPSPLRNLPRRLVPPLVGVGTSVLDAIERARSIANVEGRINQLRAQVRSVKSKIDRAERSIQEKERLIRQSRGSFNQHDCFALGFSHEALNAR